MCAIAAVEDPANDLIDDCSIPDFQSTKCEQQECAPGLKLILEHYKHLFIMNQVKHKAHTITFQHWLSCKDTTQVHTCPLQRGSGDTNTKQLDNNIIEHSSSPLMSPAVFVNKKTGDIRLYVDYRELKK